MGQIIKNASSHLLYCLERKNEIQTNDVLSVVSRGNMLNSIQFVVHFGGGEWVRYETTLHPLSLF